MQEIFYRKLSVENLLVGLVSLLILLLFLEVNLPISMVIAILINSLYFIKGRVIIDKDTINFGAKSFSSKDIKLVTLSEVDYTNSLVNLGPGTFGIEKYIAIRYQLTYGTGELAISLSQYKEDELEKVVLLWCRENQIEFRKKSTEPFPDNWSK